MEGQQRIGALVELPQVLREMGEDPASVIAGVGINPDLLRNPENSLSFVELGRLLEACVAATRCEHFGLLVGQRSATASLGLVGRLMRTAPTLKDAILDLCTNQRRYVRGAVTYLVIQNDIAFWGYAVHHPGMKAIEQIGDGAMAVAFQHDERTGGRGARRDFDLSPGPQRYCTLSPLLWLYAAVRCTTVCNGFPCRSARAVLFAAQIASCAGYWKSRLPRIGPSNNQA